jgi:hypothetical protein
MACETIRQGIFLVKSIPGRTFISAFCTESAAKLDLTGECKLFIIFEATIPCQIDQSCHRHKVVAKYLRT